MLQLFSSAAGSAFDKMRKGKKKQHRSLQESNTALEEHIGITAMLEGVRNQMTNETLRLGEFEGQIDEVGVETLNLKGQN